MYSSKEDLLTKAKTLLQDEMTSISYNTWIKTLEIDSINDNKITLIANSKMQKDAIESRLFDLVVNTFNFITNKKKRRLSPIGKAASTFTFMSN